MDNEGNLACVGTASHPDSHWGIGSGGGNNNNTNNNNSILLSKSQLKMREQALRKRVSANTSTQPTYKAPIFGIPVKIEPSESDRTQKLIKQALGDYDDFKPVIEKMFISPNPQGTPKPGGNATKSAVTSQLIATAPAHHHSHHSVGKRKRSHSLEEVDISQLIKESFALPPLLSRILNIDIVKQEHHYPSLNSSDISNSSSVLIKTEPDQNSIPNCDKSLPSGKKHPETLVSLPQSSKVASKSATTESTQLLPPQPPSVLDTVSGVKQEERGSLSPETAPSSANNWSLSCFLDTVAPPDCQQADTPSASSSSDKKSKVAPSTTSNREDQEQPHPKLLMADIDSSFSLAVSSESSKKRQRKNSSHHQVQNNQGEGRQQQRPEHSRPAPSSSNHQSEGSARLPKTYRLLARKKTPPSTPPPSTTETGGANVVVAPKLEFKQEPNEKVPMSPVAIPIPLSSKHSRLPFRNNENQGRLAEVPIAQSFSHQGNCSDGGMAVPSEVKPEFGTSPTDHDDGLSCGASGSESEYSDDATAAAPQTDNKGALERREITSLPVKIDLALIKKIPILPYHYNNDINYASSCCSNTTAGNNTLNATTNPISTNNSIGNINGLDGSTLAGLEGGMGGGVSASFASSNTANAWAPLLPPPHNPLTRWDLDGRQMAPPPSSLDIGDTAERLPAQLSRFELFSPYQYKPPTLSSCDALYASKERIINVNNNLAPMHHHHQTAQPNEQLQQHQIHQATFPPKISWGLPSQLPCVYSPTRRFDIPFWHNIGLCPELTTYPCNDIIRVAKNLKRSADREVTRNLKIMMYLDAVLYFFLNGDYMQNKKFDLTGAHKIYHDTLQVCRHISDLVQKGINSNVSDNTVMDQIFVILTQKIQALLYIKMFQCKKEQCLRNQRLLNQEFPKFFGPPPSVFSLGINSGHNYTYTHDGTSSLLNQTSSPDPSPVSSVGSTTNYGDNVNKTNVPDTDPKSMNRVIHPTVHQQLTMLEGALISHHLWDLSENGISTLSSPNQISTSNYPRHLISSNPHADYRECFTEILTVCRQPLTLNSSIWHLVIYVKFALYYLGYWLNPTYYDPQTTIPSVNTSAPPPSSKELKDFHKKNRSNHKEMAIGGK